MGILLAWATWCVMKKWLDRALPMTAIKVSAPFISLLWSRTWFCLAASSHTKSYSMTTILMLYRTICLMISCPVILMTFVSGSPTHWNKKTIIWVSWCQWPIHLPVQAAWVSISWPEESPVWEQLITMHTNLASYLGTCEEAGIIKTSVPGLGSTTGSHAMRACEQHLVNWNWVWNLIS